MSFNQKSGKIHERRSSFRREKKQLYRKPVVVYEQKVQQNSQSDTNIESYVHDDISTREQSRFLLPMIKRDRVEKVDKIGPNKQLNMKNRYFTEEREEEQNLFTVQQSEKSRKKLNKNLVEPWHRKLKKQQKSIILNYLNAKIQMTKPKRKKKKLKKSISHSRIAQLQQFVWVPTEMANRHKRNFSQSKKLKPAKLNAQERILQRQSLPHNYWRQSAMQNSQGLALQRQDKLIHELKKKIEIIERYHTEEGQSKRLPFTQNFKFSDHHLPQNKTLNKKTVNYQSTERQNDRLINKIPISQRQSISQKYENQKQKQRWTKIEKISLPKKKKIDIGPVNLTQLIQQRSPQAQKYDSQASISIINKEKLKGTLDYGESETQQRFQYSHTSIQSQVSMHSKRSKLVVQQTQRNKSSEKQKQDAANLRIWSEKQDINLRKQLSQRPISSQTKRNELKSNRSNVQVEKDIIKNDEQISKNSVSRVQVKVQKQKSKLESSGQSSEIEIESKCSDKQPKNNLSLHCIPDKQFLKLRTYYAGINKKVRTEKSLSMLKVCSVKTQLKKLPSKEELIKFIQTYTCQNTQINIMQLMKHQNFKILLEQNKQLYFGLMQDNKKSGLGITIKPNYIFEGLYKNENRVQGVQINQVGKYIGEFKDNKRQGRGQFTWKNGELYNGDWLNGKKHGNGMWSSSNGDLYIGEWVDGKVQGQGIHSSLNGQHYQGSFREYLKSGWGKQTLPNGDTYEGQFLLGQTYKGEFFNGIRQGVGILKDLEGNIYMGHFNLEQALWLFEDVFIQAAQSSIN